MLVLARQLNERIVLPTVPATIEVVSIKPGSVRLGIEAPPEIAILREEVLRCGGVARGTHAPRSDEEARLSRIKHVLRNRLDTVALGLDCSPAAAIQSAARFGDDDSPDGGRGPHARSSDERSGVRRFACARRHRGPIRAATIEASCLEEAEGGLAI